MPFRIATLLLAASLGQAATIISTFGPGDSYAATSRPFVVLPNNTLAYAVSFTPSADYVLQSIRLALQSAAQIQVEIREGADPDGTLIESVFDSFAQGILTLPSVTNPVLSKGTQYWLVARSPGLSFPDTAWFENDQGLTGYSVKPNAQPWVTSTNATPAFEITGTSRVVVPEPSTWALAVLAGVVLGARRLQRS